MDEDGESLLMTRKTRSEVSVTDVSSVASQLDVDPSSTLNDKKLNLKLNLGNISASFFQEIELEILLIRETLELLKLR